MSDAKAAHILVCVSAIHQSRLRERHPRFPSNLHSHLVELGQAVGNQLDDLMVLVQLLNDALETEEINMRL